MTKCTVRYQCEEENASMVSTGTIKAAKKDGFVVHLEGNPEYQAIKFNINTNRGIVLDRDKDTQTVRLESYWAWNKEYEVQIVLPENIGQMDSFISTYGAVSKQLGRVETRTVGIKVHGTVFEFRYNNEWELTGIDGKMNDYEMGESPVGYYDCETLIVSSEEPIEEIYRID